MVSPIFAGIKNAISSNLDIHGGSFTEDSIAVENDLESEQDSGLGGPSLSDAQLEHANGHQNTEPDSVAEPDAILRETVLKASKGVAEATATAYNGYFEQHHLSYMFSILSTDSFDNVSLIYGKRVTSGPMKNFSPRVLARMLPLL